MTLLGRPQPARRRLLAAGLALALFGAGVRMAHADPNSDYAASLQAFRAELVRLGLFLAYYDQINRVAVALGQLGPADADAALRSKAAALYNRTYTRAEFDQLVGQHRLAASAYFARVEQEIDTSVRWPGNRSATDARPAAKLLLNRSRRQYEAAIGARNDPLQALQGATAVRGFAMGAEMPPSSIDLFSAQWERIAAAMPSPTSREVVSDMVASTRAATAATHPPAPSTRPIPGEMGRPIPGEMPGVTPPAPPSSPPAIARPTPGEMTRSTPPSAAETPVKPGTAASNPSEAVAQGNALLNEGRYREALGAFDEALRAPSPPADAWIGRGRALNVLGDVVGARSAYETALRMDPGRPNLRSWLAEVAMAANDLAAAEAALGDELRRTASSAWAYSFVGTVRMLQGRDAESMQAMATAMRLDPQVAGYRYSNASFLSALGQSQRAVVELMSALRLDPSMAGALYGLGLEYGRLGRTAEAVQAYEAYLQRDATSEWAQRARQEVLRLRGQTVAPTIGPPGATISCPPGSLAVAGTCLQAPVR